MNKHLTFLLALLIGSVALASEPVTLPAQEKFHLFLLAGQSNMAGRGKVTAEDKIPHPRVLMLNQDGQWVPAVDPVHYDKKFAGVGLARSFAQVLAEKDPNIVIGLIPTACGGSSITQWEPGKYHEQTKSHPYDDAISRSKQALKDGVLKGILWHQGEADGNPKRALLYEELLTNLIQRLRTDLGAPDVPFIIGQLGQFPAKPWSEHRKKVDQAQQAVATASPSVGFVPSDGLTPNPDNVHFNADSLRIFGKRYAKIYLQILTQSSE